MSYRHPYHQQQYQYPQQQQQYSQPYPSQAGSHQYSHYSPRPPPRQGQQNPYPLPSNTPNTYYQNQTPPPPPPQTYPQQQYQQPPPHQHPPNNNPNLLPTTMHHPNPCSTHATTSTTPSTASTLTPTHALWIGKHSLASKCTPIYDATTSLPPLSTYTNADSIPDTIHKAAKASASNTSSSSSAKWELRKGHWYSRSSVLVERTKEGHSELEVAKFKHPLTATAKVDIEIQGKHPITIKPTSMLSRSNAFVLNSETYTWGFDSKVSNSRLTLRKGGGVVVARYAEKWGSGSGEGVLLVDEREVDVGVVVVTVLVMLGRLLMQTSQGSVAGGNAAANVVVVT